MSPYEELANAIVLQAVKDYRKSSKAYDRLCGGGKKLTKKQLEKKILLKKTMSDCERFFKSQWCEVLTSIDGKDLFEKLDCERPSKKRLLSGF